MLLGEFQEISGAMKNWRKWSDIVAVGLIEIISFEIKLEKILPIIVFELEVTTVGWIMYGRNIDEAKESKNSLVGSVAHILKGQHCNHPTGKLFSFL